VGSVADGVSATDRGALFNDWERAMRVLLCALEAPLPPVNGLRLPLMQLLEELGSRHEFGVVTLRHPNQAQTTAPSAWRLLPPPDSNARGRARSMMAFARGRPLRSDHLARHMGDELRREAARMRPDVVWVFSGRLAAVWRYVDAYPRVLSALDAWHRNVEAEAQIATWPKSTLLRAEARRVRHFEVQEFARYERVVVVTDDDRRALSELAPSLPLAVVPNGVHAERFAVQTDVDPERVVFHGVLSFGPNIAAAERLAVRILPRIRARRPRAHVAIVGYLPTPRVRALARCEGVDVTGAVDDVAPWLAGSAVYICPMESGTGIKNKLLEAMAAGVPCVATPRALQGLSVTHGEHLLIADTDDGLADAAAQLMADRALARRISGAASAYVRERHTWSAVAAAFEQVLEDAAAVKR
jgi:polysaccharide biosynthesis protein PslH